MRYEEGKEEDPGCGFKQMTDLLHCKCFQEVCYFKIPGAADEDHHKSTCSSRKITASNQVFMD